MATPNQTENMESKPSSEHIQELEYKNSAPVEHWKLNPAPTNDPNDPLVSHCETHLDRCH
jgi:hypothetical protein